MSPSRSQFLRALFQRLNAASIPWCIQRNYADVYEDASSDIDLLVCPENLDAAKQQIELAAKTAGHRLLTCTRYVNHSLLYQGPNAEFIRVDIDTEIRWRSFQIRSAAEALHRRERLGEFFVPQPLDESIILLTAALWRGNLSERYRNCLAELAKRITDTTEHKHRFESAFGSIGRRLAEIQSNLKDTPPPRGLWREARRSVILNSVLNPSRALQAFRFAWRDAMRLLARATNPPGISISHLSARGNTALVENLLDSLRQVFPADKCKLMSSTPRELATIWTRALTLLKGGVFVESRAAASDAALARLLKRSAPRLFSARSFLLAEASNNNVQLASCETGRMAEFSSADSGSGAVGAALDFICSNLARSASKSSSRAGKGVFAVLVGLDGSGKTTVARRICSHPEIQERFLGIQYIHWQPRVGSRRIFPFPEYANLPRKSSLPRGMIQSTLSALRLLKNLVLTRIAFWLKVRPSLRKNTLVLVDRYFYNYYLDPVSLKYYGSSALLNFLARFFPKPDLLLRLKAPAEVLLARKQELSPDEILRQAALLDNTPFNAGKTLELDATLPADEIARLASHALLSSST